MFFKEEWYKIPLETVQNLYESIQKRTAAVLKVKGKEMFAVYVVFPLFCPTLVIHVIVFVCIN
jgi:hypothetical protein